MAPLISLPFWVVDKRRCFLGIGNIIVPTVDHLTVDLLTLELWRAWSLISSKRTHGVEFVSTLAEPAMMPVTLLPRVSAICAFFHIFRMLIAMLAHPGASKA